MAVTALSGQRWQGITNPPIIDVPLANDQDVAGNGTSWGGLCTKIESGSSMIGKTLTSFSIFMKRDGGNSDLTFGVFDTTSTSSTPDHVFTVSGVTEMTDLTSSYAEYTATGSCVLAENDGVGFVQTNASSADMNTDFDTSPPSDYPANLNPLIKTDGGSWRTDGYTDDTAMCGAWNDGVPDDKATLVTAGEADGYAIGDGSQYAHTNADSTAHYKFLHGASGSTASTAFWIYRDGNQDTEDMVCSTCDNSSASGHQGASVYFMSDNNIHYLISAGDDANAPFTSTGVTIADQTWTHIACTLSESGGTYTMRIYKNGVNTDTTGTDTETFTFTPSTSSAQHTMYVFRKQGGNMPDGRVADMGFWEDHVLSQADITKLASGTRITDDGTGFDYSSSDIVDHYPFFTDTLDTKDSTWYLYNAGLTFGTTGAPTAISASSNLPNGTQFEQTNDYKTFQLNDGVWTQRGTAI